MFSRTHAFFFKNQTMRQTVIKNTFWLFSGQTVGQALRAIIVIYAARVLGSSNFGIVSYTLSITGIFIIITDFGISTILTKSIAQKPEKQEYYFSTLFTIKCVLAAFAFLAIISISPFITVIPDTTRLFFLAALILIFDNMRDFTISLVRGREKMEWEAILVILTSVAVVFFGFFFLTLRTSPASFLTAYATGSFFGLALALIVLRRYLMNLRAHIDWQIARAVIYESLPLAYAGILSATMLNIDIIMIGWWRPVHDVGLYAAAQKPIQFIYGFTTIIGAGLFPMFCRLAAHHSEQFRSILRRILSITLLINTALAVFIIIGSTYIITLLYGNSYATASSVFKLLALTLVINTFIVITFNALLAAGKQKVFVISSPLAALSNAGLNALFIPWWGIEGAALSTLLTQFAVSAYLWKKMREV